MRDDEIQLARSDPNLGVAALVFGVQLQDLRGDSCPFLFG